MTRRCRSDIAAALAGLLAAALLTACASAPHHVERTGEAIWEALDGGLRPTVVRAGEALPRWSLRERMAHHHVPGVAIAVVNAGRVTQVRGFGVRAVGTADAVDGDTLFSVGSVSKVVAAAVALRLVAGGRLELDRDIGGYLTSWRVPPAPELGEPHVTLRMLMSHTAGFNVHGFEDYLPHEPLPSILDTLDGKPPAKSAAIHLIAPPGARMIYSGGGIMVEQLVIEDVMGAPLESVAREQVFAPLGMRRSTYVNPLPEATVNVARAHDERGAAVALPRGWQSFPEQAASGLWTSARELGGFVAALITSYRGKDGFLPQTIATQMMTEVGPSWHGLGPRLSGAGVARSFHHAGSNDSYRAWIEGYLESGDGFVILTNGAGGGQLMLEIRNALAEALGHGGDPLIRSATLDLAAPGYADYAGTYRLDPAAPSDLRGSLDGYFATDTLQVKVAAGAITITEPSQPDSFEVWPLSPARFVRPTDLDPLQFEFHRDARGTVRVLSVDRNSSRLYYRKLEP
jgi:CubicO group peptidase (beta-lactamase class C family)